MLQAEAGEEILVPGSDDTGTNLAGRFTRFASERPNGLPSLGSSQGLPAKLCTV
jgi:hypothetical protein